MPVAVSFVLAVLSFAASLQQTLTIEVRSATGPVDGASVVVAGMPHKTDARGAVVAQAPAGTVRVTVSHDGYLTVDKDVTVPPGSTQQVIVTLDPEPTHEEEITVSATRTDKRLEDQPMRVEVLGREEIEEK